MNVIGIVQTDLNEFNVLFEPEQQNNQGSGQGQSQGNRQNDQGQDGGSLFLNFLGDTQDQEQSGQGQSGQGQSGPQEMTVRIKGIPEGQKSTILQMYQIIQDAKNQQDLEKSLTIVSRGDDQQNQNQQGQYRYQTQSQQQ
jgi:hypothetical protein